MLTTTCPTRAQIPCSDDVTAVIQAPDCGIFGAPSIGGRGLNERGDVVGEVCDCAGEDEEAWWWTAEAGFGLLNMPDGASNSTAMDINDLGLMTGYVEITGDDTGRVAFLHDGIDVVTFETFKGGTYIEGLAINNNLQIVGNWGNNVNGDPAFEAFVWDAGVMQPLGGVLRTPNSTGKGINERGPGYRRRVVASVWLDRPASRRSGRVRASGKLDGPGNQ